jgi:hypothetical protein
LISSRAALVERILIPTNSHAALGTAAQLLAKDFSLPESAIGLVPPGTKPQRGELLLTTQPPTAAGAALLGLPTNALPADGYGIVFSAGATVIYGQRPRALLFAVGDMHHWRNRTNGIFLRQPAFAFRSASLHGRLPLAEQVVRTGVNVVIGRGGLPVTLEESLPAVFARLGAAERSAVQQAARRAAEAHQRLAAECRAADVEYYPLLYGNDLRRWSPELYAAALQAFPTAAGRSAPASWEKGTLCPSDTNAWKLIRACVGEFIQRSGADGLYATFWDDYGLFCQCDRCVASGLNQFSNQLYACVGNYHRAATALGRPLVVRTWSSGVPHWLRDEWVHAPGNGGPSGEPMQLWSRVIGELPADIAIQTKVYQADCQPDPPFSDLLGHAAPHREIAEHQITGQTTGRFYFPASTVDHTAWTLRKSRGLVGANGGASLFPGGTRNARYDLFADIANSINVHAWRELTWNPDADVGRIWLDWAKPIYGEQAAPIIIRALRRSESAVNRLFSALGLGNDTNSGFPGNIERRETLLKYTNRYYRKEGQDALAPTLENVARVIAEKEDCMRQIEMLQRDLDEAVPFLKQEQAAELRVRFDWLREFAQVARHLDESLWRYSYLRQHADAEQMRHLAASWDAVQQHYRRMFRFDPTQQLSGYDVPLGRLPSKPSLGSPLPLMTELYQESRALVEQSLGRDSVPPEWRRDEARAKPAQTNAP